MSTTIYDFTYTLTPQSEENEALNALGKGRIKEFEPKSYFFTESTITAQSSAEGAYGPDYVSTNTKFNITTQFELANKKAYAVISGQVLIVPQTGEGNESKVNVFIKPLQNVDVGVPIKYYVYRGLKKELFIDSDNNILPEDNTNTPFMAKVWKDLISHNELEKPYPKIPANLFGFNTTETSSNSLDAKFFNTYDITTTDGHKVYNLAFVEAGQYFGDFKDNKGGFEIVLNDGFYYQEKSDTGFQFDLNYAKAEKVVLDLADIASNPNISEKIYRENVQKFLDPAAFYGAHITTKENGEVKVVDNDAKYNTKADIYNNIISKFSNKHKCYIYLQCNRGRSFNFDEVLGTDPLKIGVSETLAPSQYKTNEWPIIINEFEQTHTEDENEKRKSINDLSFQLKFKTETKNVTLYNSHGNCGNDAIDGNFLNNKALIDEANIVSQEYTNTVNYKLINNYNLTDNSLVAQNIATFIYINHEEKEFEYFNNFFGPININPIIKVPGEATNSVIQKASNKNLKINSQSGTLSVYNQELIVNDKVGASDEDNKTRLYVLKRRDSVNNNQINSNQSISSGDGFSYLSTKEEYNAYVYGDKNYSVWKGTIGHGTGKTRTLQLINFHQDANIVSDFMQLGLTEFDFNNLIYDSEEKLEHSTHLPKDATNLFFHLDESNITYDPVYKKYKLGIKYQINNEIVFAYPTNPVYVYTVDGYYFFTKVYSEKFEFAEEFGNSTINFRPKGDYQGEFGFDWLRVTGDGEPSYESIIESGYKKTEGIANTKFTKEEAFEALKKEYTNIKTQVEQEIYYVPFLNIYPPDPTSTTTALSTVKLKGIPLIDENSININFNYDTSLLSVSSNLTVIDQFTSDIEITITCLKEFDTDQIIKTIGTSKDSTGNIQENVIGLIKVCKNSKPNMSAVDVVFVKVLTDITKSGNIDLYTDYPTFVGTDEIKQLKNTLLQSFVNFENLETNTFTLNMSNDLRFQRGGTYYKKQKEKINDVEVDMEYIHNLDKNGIVPGMQDVLIAKLNIEAPQFTNYIKVFVFAVNGLNPENEVLMGRSNGIGSKACAIYKRRKVPVLAHEFLHTIGLCHTHIDGGLIENPHQKYVYPKYNADRNNPPLHIDDATDNIMSYNFGKMKSTWKWQWKILNSILNKTI